MPRHEFVNANGLRFHCLVEGEGPLLLLLHGFPETSHAWRHQIPALAKHFKVVAPDLRGYGDSDKPRGLENYSPDKLTADIPALIEAHGAKKAVVVGHDWGGGLAWELALNYPQVIEKLVVINCPHPAIFPRRMFTSPRQLLRSWYMFFFQIPWLPDFLLPRIVARAIPDSSTRPEAFTAADRAELTAAFRKPGAATAALNYYRAAFRSGNIRGRLFGPPDTRKISVPTLLLWGMKDTALGPELIEGMEPLFEGPFTLKRFPEASHWVAEEFPEDVNRAVLAFVLPS